MAASSIRAETLIGRWGTPLKGVLRGLPPYSIPDDALWDGFNVTLKAGAIVARPGLTVFNAGSLQARVTGAIAYTALGQGAFDDASFDVESFITVDSVGSILVAATQDKVWAFYGGSWHDITGSALTAGEFDFARITGIQLGTTIYVLISNGIDAPQQWDSVAATTSAVAGTPPKWTDICTASDRIIGIIPPYTVRWGNALAIDTWPAQNFRVLSDTLDKVVAIRNLGTLGVVVYKDRSIWIGQPGGQTDASYFTFAIRGFFDGPASPAAVVDVDGAHFYMTDLGRVGYFDGSRHEWVADGVWPLVQDDLEQVNAGHIFGVFEPLRREVYFYYPRHGDSGRCRGLVIVKVPNRAEGIDAPASFRGAIAFPVSIGTDNRTDERQALVFGDNDFLAYFVGGDLDGNSTFTGYFQTGFLTVPAGDPYRLDAFEVFAERGSGYGTLRSKIVKNDLLENPNTDPSATAQDIDLSEITPTQARGGDIRGRFLSLRFEFETPIVLRWYGARLSARRIEPSVPQGRVAY